MVYERSELLSRTNADLILHSVSITNGGSYQVKVTGSQGSVLSLPASLNITPAENSDRSLVINGAGYEAVYDADKVTGVGASFVSQLYVGRNETSMHPIGNPIA